MEKWKRNPTEEVYEYEIEGNFRPEKFHPSWFVEQGLLGQKEATEANIIEIIKDEVTFFSTKFIRIYVNKETFRVSTSQILSFDLVKEMIFNVSKILENTIDNCVSFKVKLHYKLSSKKELQKVLNSFNNNDSWNEILDKPQVVSLRLFDSKNIGNHFVKRIISLFPCERLDMENTVHIYLTHNYDINSKKEKVSSFIDKNENVLDEAVSIVNKIIKAYL